MNADERRLREAIEALEDAYDSCGRALARVEGVPAADGATIRHARDLIGEARHALREIEDAKPAEVTTP